MSAFLYQGIKNTQQAAFDTALFNHAVDISNGTDLSVLGQLIVKRSALIDEDKIFPFHLGQSIVQIRSVDGSVILSSRPLDFVRLPLSRKTMIETVNQGATFDTFQSGSKYRLVNYLMQKSPLPPLILQVAVPLQMLENERRQILSLLWTIIPLTLLGAGFGGLVLVRRALDPVNKIIKTAQSIQAKELSARVPVPRETELNELALTLNELLSRLQKAFDGQEKFIADASHQLKTPLAIIRGEIDVYRRMPQNDGAHELLESVSQEVDQLSRMVDNLLLLARFDSGVLAPEFQKVRIDEALIESISLLGRLSRDEKVDLQFDFATKSDEASDFEALGDFDLLRVLFYNLLENAIKYSPKPGHVKIQLSYTEPWISVEIEDYGPGIKQEELGRVFDRFFRGSERQLQASGVGLGLSIVSRIAKIHGADVNIASTPGQGTTFSVRIKKV